MDRRRRRASSSSVEDELALVKAAAWAWYQHGSGNEGSAPTREFDLARRARAPPRPSRYKLEAVREADQDVEPGPCSSATSPTHTESSLLDFYEVERITRELDRLIASSQKRERRREAPAPLQRVATKMVGGFWVRHAVGICRSADDVIEPRALAARRRRKPPLSASSLGAHAV